MIHVDALSQLTREWGYPRQFAWDGQNDCGVFANHAVELIRGKPAIKWPKYTTAAGAVRALKKMGFDHLDAAFDAHLFRLPEGTTPAQGDLFAVLPADGGPWNATAVSHGGWRGFGCFDAGRWVLADVQPENRVGAVWRVV